MGGHPRLAGQPTRRLFPIGIGQGAARELAEITCFDMARHIPATAKAPPLCFDECDPAIERLVNVGLLWIKVEPKFKTTLLKLTGMALFAQAPGAILMGGGL